MGLGSGVQRGQSERGPAAATRPNSTVEACMVEYHLHVDADRDGVVDDDRSHNDRWAWGPGSKGAIILCNNDDENRRRRCDNEDAEINAAPDPDDIAPLVIRRVAGHPPAPGSWRGFLEVSAEDAPRVRVFASRSSEAAQVLGAGVVVPSEGSTAEAGEATEGDGAGAGEAAQNVTPAVLSWTLPDLNFTEKELGVEAVMYAQGSFNGEVVIKLRIERGAAGTHEEQVRLRVAPWIAFNHLDPTTRVYVGEAIDNAEFRRDLAAQVAAAGLPPPEVAEAAYGRDRWLQDAMEIGFSSLPRTGPPAARHLPVVLRTANDREKMGWGPIDRYPRERMLEPGFGWVQAMPPSKSGGTLDSFGNLECSPPFTHSGRGKEYKFGRLIYGEHPGGTARRNMQRDVVDFLRAQRVQEPFALNTGWLEVGHVDEVMSFVPVKNAPKKFKVALASPTEAVTILRRLKAARQGTAPLLRLTPPPPLPDHPPDVMTPQDQYDSYHLRTVDEVLDDSSFMNVQTTVQGSIDGIKAKLMDELDLAETDFIPLPVLFMTTENNLHVAYTPGVVNMLVLTKPDKTVRLVIPKPFGPEVGGVCQFESNIRTALGPPADTGVDLEFVDDFFTYHVNYGEIHCGTNSKREPPVDRWWWEQQV
ncbi:protein-arginine deiminase family protein [Nannocystis sp. RBIL2]|uniref:protein-arginine deiminase family protein n=1 Tax=Nannocystis sp. RBIL2 TaxID=2996788 RepID=UPI00226D6CFD|nr:protein-arginine deiminase family protein [Nannocystis sp. RBIL2]MCY1071522.1 protein-arginine deiminase family protein [Nannocystis sp. RBIL2]